LSTVSVVEGGYNWFGALLAGRKLIRATGMPLSMTGHNGSPLFALIWPVIVTPLANIVIYLSIYLFGAWFDCVRHAG